MCPIRTGHIALPANMRLRTLLMRATFSACGVARKMEHFERSYFLTVFESCVMSKFAQAGTAFIFNNMRQLHVVIVETDSARVAFVGQKGRPQAYGDLVALCRAALDNECLTLNMENVGVVISTSITWPMVTRNIIFFTAFAFTAANGQRRDSPAVVFDVEVRIGTVPWAKVRATTAHGEATVRIAVRKAHNVVAIERQTCRISFYDRPLQNDTPS